MQEPQAEKYVSNIDALTASDLGFAALVEERRTGDDKMTYVEGCKNPKVSYTFNQGWNSTDDCRS